MSKITVPNVQPKPYKRGGQTFQPANTQGTYNAIVTPGRSIRIYGTNTNHSALVDGKWIHGDAPFDRTFQIGDEAEYHSYNLRYTGKIIAIGPKTVTIQHYPHEPRVTMLDLFGFIDRNWDFDAVKIAHHNAEELQCI